MIEKNFREEDFDKFQSVTTLVTTQVMSSSLPPSQLQLYVFLYLRW